MVSIFSKEMNWTRGDFSHIFFHVNKNMAHKVKQRINYIPYIYVYIVKNNMVVSVVCVCVCVNVCVCALACVCARACMYAPGRTRDMLRDGVRLRNRFVQDIKSSPALVNGHVFYWPQFVTEWAKVSRCLFFLQS